jgi:hypothetical protein
MNTPEVILAIVTLLFATVASGDEPLREWTSDTGSKIKASLESVTYTLKKEDGTTISVPASRLDFGGRGMARALTKEPIGKTLDEILSVAKQAYEGRQLESIPMISLSGKAFLTHTAGLGSQVTSISVLGERKSPKDFAVAVLIVLEGIRTASDEENQKVGNMIAGALDFIDSHPSSSATIPVEDLRVQIDCVRNTSVSETLAVFSTFVEQFASGDVATYRLKLLS